MFAGAECLPGQHGPEAGDRADGGMCLPAGLHRLCHGVPAHGQKEAGHPGHLQPQQPGDVWLPGRDEPRHEAAARGEAHLAAGLPPPLLPKMHSSPLPQCRNDRRDIPDRDPVQRRQSSPQPERRPVILRCSKTPAQMLRSVHHSLPRTSNVLTLHFLFISSPRKLQLPAVPYF